MTVPVTAAVPDAVVLLLALAVVYLPGLALLALVGVRSRLIRVAMAPAASVAVAGAVAVGAALTGLPYGPVPLAAATALLALGPLVAVVRGRGWKRRRRDRTGVLAGTAMVLVGIGFAAVPWLRGLGGLDTRAQEHDMILHVLQTAYITRSGRAAPWELLPTDVLSGAPVWFYPSGAHLLAAAVAGVTGDVVAATNAATVVLLAVAVCTGVAALAVVAARQLGMGRSAAMLAGGVASLVMAGMYRPAFHLMHDGGIFANAASLSLVPGVVAGVLAMPWSRARAGVGAGAAAAGAVWVHPSAAVSIAVTVLAWWLGQAVTRTGRAQLRASVAPVLAAAPVTVALLAPVVVPGLAEAGRTADWPPDTVPVSFMIAVGETFGFPYSGWIDQAQSTAQVWVALLLAAGVAVVVARRRGLGPVAAWAAWGAIVIAAWTSPGSGADALVTRFFYHAMLRTWSHLSLLAPVLAGLGVVLVAVRVAVLARRRVPVPAGAVAVTLVAVFFVGYALVAGAGYARVNTHAVATRYTTPEFVRIGADDRAAIDWLAAHVRPGERVFNSPNDGSTYLYVDRGVPVVNVATLGIAGIPYTYRLLESFHAYPSDTAVRRQLADLNVRWVYVDSDPPPIGSSGSPEGWAVQDPIEIPPGLTGLDGLPGLEPAFVAGSVIVYSLDLSAVDEEVRPAFPP